MKILEIIPNLCAGGAETFVVNLSNELVLNKDVNVTILTFYDNDSSYFLKDKLSSNIKQIILPKKNGIDFLLSYRLYRLIAKEHYDVVHCHLNSISYILFASLFFRKCSYFSTIHNDAYKEASGIHRVIRRIMFFFNLVNPITISTASHDSFLKLYHKSAPIIYNAIPENNKIIPVDVSKFKHSNQTKVFICPASVIPHKNQIALASAFNKCYQNGADVSLILIGKGKSQYCQNLREYLSDCVFYLGEVSNPIDYMASSDYYILASFYEGLPISLLEAISVGCIPVVTPVGGNIDVVKDLLTGFIIPTQSEHDIYKTINIILNYKDEALQDIRTRIASMKNNFTMNSCASNYLKLFQRFK